MKEKELGDARRSTLSPEGATESANETEKEATNSPPKGGSKLWNRLPTWISTNARSSRSLKLLVRCWVASWLAFVIILPTKSLAALGSAGFFSLLASFFLPPMMPVQMFIFVILTLVVGLLAGWGIGAGAMRAALAVRSPAIIRSAMQTLQSSPGFAANPTGATTVSIFNGEFLDVRSSVMYGCFLAVAAWFFAFVRAYAPKLTLLSIFGTIAVDVFCSYGPLFPTARYTLLNSIVISVGVYSGLGILSTLLLFPETMNHACLFETVSLLDRVTGFMKLQGDVLRANEDGLASDSPLLGSIKATKAAAFGGIKALMSKSGFINIEFAWGRFSGDDVRELEEPLLAIISRLSGLESFARIVGRTHAAAATRDDGETTTSSKSDLGAPLIDTFLLRQLHETTHKAERNHSLGLQRILPIVESSTSDLRHSCIAGIGASKNVLEGVNKRRWRKNTELDAQHLQALQSSIEALRRDLEEFKSEKRKLLIEPYLEVMRSAKTRREQEALPLRSLYLAYVFGSTTLILSAATLAFMEKVLQLAEKRTKNRLWAPKGLRAIGKLLLRRGDKADETFGDDAPPSEESSPAMDGSRSRKDPDSRPPTNAIQKLMNALHSLYRWAKTPEAVFTFKYTIITIALWLPSVFKSSANFNYVQKGLWALIMAQTILNVYIGDLVFNLFTRLLGTFIGLVFGLLAWYIGNGSGPGNPYGSAASLGVFLIPMVFLRLFAPPQYAAGTILASVTFALIIGYSWVDNHIAQFASPGVGWSVAWRRWTLVAVGCTAALIISVVPPTSGRKAVRRRNAAAIMKISDLWASLISIWITTPDKHDPKAPEPWLPAYRVKLIGIFEEIETLTQLTALAKWEGSIRGVWPFGEYMKLAQIETEMVGSLAQLGGALSRLDHTWKTALLHDTKVLNPNFISDVLSVFALVSQSLRTGEPLHTVLPQTLLERLFYHDRTRSVAAPVEGEDEKQSDLFDVGQLQSIEYMHYASAIVAVYQILRSLDEIHAVTRKLCGESVMPGFDVWKREHDEVVFRRGEA